VSRFPIAGNVPDQPDEFAAMGVSGKADIVRLFADSFYFGCEADDRGMVTAFLPSNPGGARLRAVLGSDIGHWDVTDIAGVVAEAHELVEKGFLTDEQWRQIVFDNPVEMLTRVNPDFFVGTAVADDYSFLHRLSFRSIDLFDSMGGASALALDVPPAVALRRASSGSCVELSTLAFLSHARTS